MSPMGFVQICCQLKMLMLTKTCVLTRTYICILQARALTPQTGETDAIRFLVGTQSLKFDNQVWGKENGCQEKKCTWFTEYLPAAEGFKCNLGSVVFFLRCKSLCLLSDDQSCTGLVMDVRIPVSSQSQGLKACTLSMCSYRFSPG